MNAMNVKEISRWAMMCALYGVLVLINTQTAAFFDLYFSILFALPVLIGSFKNKGQGTGLALGAMLLITMIFAPLTSWPRQMANLAAGAVYGWGLEKDKSLSFCFCTGFAVCAAAEYLSTAVFFQAAGLGELAGDPLYAYAASWLNLKTLAACYAVLSGLMESFLALCLSQIILIRWFKRKRKPVMALQPVRPEWFSVSMLVLSAAAGVFWKAFETNAAFQALLASLLFLNYLILDYNGIWFLLGLRKTRPSFWMMFVLIMIWVIPPLNLVYVCAGFWCGLAKLFKTRILR